MNKFNSYSYNMFKRVRVKKLSRNNVVNIKVLSPSHVASRQIFPISNIHKSKLIDDILTSTRKFSFNTGSHLLTTYKVIQTLLEFTKGVRESPSEVLKNQLDTHLKELV